jgi:hypothetical protein
VARKNAGPIGTFFIGLVFTAVGGGITYFKAWPDYQAAKESVSWPQANGIILSSKVITSRGTKNKTNYSADISYSFKVKGEQYQSSQIYIGSEGTYSSSSKDAYKYKNKYPKGTTVNVYYSPKEEANSILEPGVNTIHYIFLGAGLLFGGIGLLLLTVSFFKLAIFAAIAGVFLGSLFGKKKDEQKPRSSNRAGSNTKRKKLRANPKKESSVSDLDDIDLDDEMSHFNKVSSTSLPAHDEPWKYQWLIKGTDKDHGPFSFDQIIGFYEKGKVKANHKCAPSDGGQTVKISEIINKMVS